MPMVGFRIRSICMKEGVYPRSIENTIIAILIIAGILVLFARKQCRVADSGKVQNLGHNSRDPIVSCFDGKCRSLPEKH